MEFIKTFNQALSPEFCQEIINKFEEDKEHQMLGVFGDGTESNDNVKQSTDLLLNRYEEWNGIKDILHQCLSTYLPLYMESIMTVNERLSPFMSPNIVDTGYQIQRTEPGQFYDWHNDTNIIEYFVHQRPIHRHLAYIWYLNDVPEEDDGYTEFIDGTRIQPEAGKLLFFPSTWTYLHRGVTPKNTTKYIIAGWMCNLRDDNDINKGMSENMMENNFD